MQISAMHFGHPSTAAANFSAINLIPKWQNVHAQLAECYKGALSPGEGYGEVQNKDAEYFKRFYAHCISF
jgi:hypothetical protein